jgi:hypothetical protein
MRIGMRQIFFCLVLLTAAYELAADDSFLGTYSLVTESDCYAEIEFFANGKGEFRDICSTEGATARLSTTKTEFSWQEQAGRIIVKLPDSKKTFVYRADLPCEDFGYPGNSPGFVSGEMSYFRVPLDCK